MQDPRCRQKHSAIYVYSCSDSQERHLEFCETLEFQTQQCVHETQ